MLSYYAIKYFLLFLCLITAKFSISLVMYKVGPSRSKFIKNIRLKEFGAKASWQFRVASFAWVFIWKNYAYGRKTKFGVKYGKIKYGRILIKF